MQKKSTVRTIIMTTVVLVMSMIILTGCLNQTSADITEAQNIALEDAGIDSSEAEEITCSASDDGDGVYYVTFSHNNSVYSYTINSSGEIIEKNVTSTDGQSVVSESTTISESDALSSAISDAGFSASDIAVIKTEKDYDDGVLTYEIDFYAGDSKYSYTISATTGEIIERELEAAEDLTNDFSETEEGSDIDAAVETALNDAGVKSEDATITKAETDTDDGIKVYEIEFIFNNTEYEYEINADTGAIIERSEEPAD